MLNIGLFGLGHLGKIHLQQWQEIENINIVGIYDIDEQMAKAVAEEKGVKHYSDADELINACDAIDIISTTTTHYEIAEKVIKKGKHLFIEKPMAANLEQAKAIMNLSNEAGIKCQIGHVERFNPAFLALEGKEINPLFIECHRLSQFNPRGTDVSVILDLMIHDIDVIMSLVKSDLKRVAASGVNVISDTSDIANVRLEFANGCVANLTASRISLKKMRKMRIFQRDAYISIDFLEKKTEIVTIQDDDGKKGLLDFPIELPNGKKRKITVDIPQNKNTNAIRMELQKFVDCIENNTAPVVSAHDGYQAMDIAYQILDKIKENLKK
jgi:predicted dehydrogenase